MLTTNFFHFHTIYLTDSRPVAYKCGGYIIDIIYKNYCKNKTHNRIYGPSFPNIASNDPDLWYGILRLNLLYCLHLIFI